jgi:ribosome recycling factor
MKEQLESAKSKMEKCVNNLSHEYSSIRAGRANPAVLDKISVDYYGTPTQIQQMAAVSVPEARTLMIQPWDASQLKPIEKAILSSELGINPTNDGKSLRLVFPQPTEERRREIVKQVHKYAEEAKVAVRNSRRDAIEKLKSLKKTSELTEDDLKDGEKEAQKLTDKYCEEIDKLSRAKEKEIMSI